MLPTDDSELLVKKVVTMSYHDANLRHNVITGRLVTKFLHFANKTPVKWHSNNQATVETATYGSEHLSTRISSKKISDIRITLRHMGVNLRKKSCTFGHANSVVDSIMTMARVVLQKGVNLL